MHEVFLSYRRDDARGSTGRLADRLRSTFGADRIFRDLDAIAPGDDFEAALERAIVGARVVLVVIGPRWRDCVDADGRRRLDDPTDTVRREIESSFTAGVPVIPVLVDGARMPTADAVPTSLAALTRCQAVELDDTRWDDDCRRLVDVLCRHHGLQAADGSPAGAARDRASVLLDDLLELIVAPGRMLPRVAGTQRRDALGRALVLLVVCLAVGGTLIGLPLDVALTTWVLTVVLLGSLAAAALIGAIATGWRVVGARPGWQRMISGGACLFAGAVLYACVGLMVFEFGLMVTGSAQVSQAVALIRQGTPFRDALAASGWQPNAPAMTGIALATVPWTAGLVWLAFAWNGLRLAFLARLPASACAAAVVVVLIWVIFKAAAWAAAPI